MDSLTFKIINHSSPEYVDAIKLREGILRHPLGLTFSSEELAAEKNDIHVVGMLGSELISTAVLVSDDNDYKMRQVAVKQGIQASGVGSKMLEFCENYARHQSIRTIYCHARESAINFYLKNNYVAEGDYFVEVAILHLKMRKRL